MYMYIYYFNATVWKRQTTVLTHSFFSTVDFKLMYNGLAKNK